MAAAEPATVLPPTNLPQPVSELIGRDAESTRSCSLVGAHRLVTLTGAGGIGKTRLALAVARRLLPQFADGVWLAEFSPLSDPDLVPATVAAAVGLELGGGEVSAQRVAQALAARRAAAGAGHLRACDRRRGGDGRGGAAGRFGGAYHRHQPRAAAGGGGADLPGAAARRARRGGRTIRWNMARFGCSSSGRGRQSRTSRRTGALAATIAAICRRLDGIPLAIELAAARAAALGIEELAARLDDRFQLLTGGRRTALPRHQTLRATLDWSYELLAEPERVVLRRLAVFAGAFSLEAAGAVVAERRGRAVGRRRRRFQPGREIAGRGGGRRRRRALSPARHDPGLCARKARRKRRA